MIKVCHNNKIYEINKEKILFILSKLNNNSISELEIEKLMEKYGLMDEYFLENINKL